ncbi:DUF4435 domain-containing protein [Pleionea sp. CnH1-48]|uniref:DUF4435 domain-containing protein n=1 Tax=Pleionea sp. CnH1-48 TaxID=2954494 RepID=UPI00209761AC|nr:DUF4435 domain-containing protein [Pleionea sp. CnH1-48]MCO7225999.1 DUF4435 domain-containing protein [Pleionea sp. CnH1-48]
MEFIRVRSKDSKVVVCIFEGEDEKYFSHRISEALAPVKWYSINAGGRKNVLELYQVIISHPAYRESRFTCFIDRDYEYWYENPDPSRIYVTPCYSIENLYISEESFIKIISSEFGLAEFGEESGDFQTCLKLFRSFKRELIEHLSQFNYWVKAHRIMNKSSSDICSLNVRNVKLSHLVNIGLSGTGRVYDTNNILSVFRDYEGGEICPEAHKKAKLILSEKDPESAFRGKQLLESLRVFLTLLKNDRTKENPSVFSKRGTVKLNLSNGNVISELSQYAATPECFNDFIKSYKAMLAA